MKRTILYFTLLFAACSKGDSKDLTPEKSFNPPSWILGKWMMDRNVIGSEIGFEFADNDFCYIVAGTTTCFKSVLGTLVGTDAKTDIVEEQSNNHYKVSVTLQGTTHKYHFVKVSNTEIQEILTDPNGHVSYYKSK
jgi:hypothetical protein